MYNIHTILNTFDVFDFSSERFFTSLLAPILYPVISSRRIFWLYLLVAFIVGALVYFYLKKRQHHDVEQKSLWQYLFPKALYGHPSTLLDFKFFYTNTALQILFLFPLALWVSPTLVLIVKAGLFHLGLPGEGIIEPNIATFLLFSFLLATALDFGLFFGHYLLHKVPFLWEFHKVHHTAEVMTPITVYRMHPIDNLLIMVMGALSTGIIGGILQFYYGGQGIVFQVSGANLFFALYYLFGYNLRHTHIWLDYGPFFDRIFMSPAQHQIHHSAEPRHFDKNQGFLFSFWDALFGTLYVPKGREEFPLGIDDLEDQKHYNRSVWALFWRPFENMIQKFQLAYLWNPKKLALAAIFIVPVTWALILNTTYTEPLATVDPNVYMENQTWQEIQNRVNASENSPPIAIIPTGGTEQNGRHMTLGKHNYIVRYTAGRIAEKLDHALVAPVMAYVPEGGLTEGHMRFSGTLSTPEPLFEAVLEHTARSLKAHGFKLICLVGDSGGNQLGQQHVADKLTAEWQAEGVTVLHVSDYYSSRNGQRAWLINQGYARDIGTHAGIMDTSELLAVHPENIRKEHLKNNIKDEFLTVGSDGDTTSASSILGNALIEMKIDAAVRQIQVHKIKKVR